MDVFSVCMERRLLNYWIYITLQQYIEVNLKTLYKQNQKYKLKQKRARVRRHTHTHTHREKQIRTQACELANGKQNGDSE